MARMRSPNFPSLSLEEAVVVAKAIWDKNRKAAIPREAAAKDLGYTGLTGRSMTVLGALNQYGLVEITSKGQTRVTQMAENIFIGYPEDVKRAAVSQAGRSPGLFREIYDKYDGHIPGENAIRSFLFQKGFTNDGVEKALKSFNATNRYVEIYGEAESYGNDDQATPDSASDTVSEEEETMETAVIEPDAKKTGVTFYKSGPLDFQLSTSGLALTGKTASAKELKAFISKLTALTAMLPDDLKEEE